MHSLGASALSLAERGLFIFPLLARDKRPATGHGLKDATRDPALIRGWWAENPEFNIGVATGAASRIFVVDVDDAEAELRKLETANGTLPATVESITAKGRHLFFRWPKFKIRNSVGKLAPGIDIRGEGGYVVGPPSIHPSGRRYHWSVDSAKRTAEAPDWLLAKLARDLVANGADEGTRDCNARLLWLFRCVFCNDTATDWRLSVGVVAVFLAITVIAVTLISEMLL